MSSGQFCPRCGDPVPERPDPLPGPSRDSALCDACYFADFSLVDAPDRVEIRVCSGCGAVHRGNRWVDVDARDYTDVAVDAVTEALGVHVAADAVEWGVDPEQVDPTTVRMHCRFSGRVRGTPLEETVVVPVRIARETCSRCGRIAGGYYASLVQVRATDRTPTAHEEDRALELARDHVGEREAAGDREAFVADVAETPDGLDIKLSTTGIGQAVAGRIAEDLGGDVETHPTLVTEDADGEEVYRVTYAVRLPAFSPGDVIDPADGDGPVLVRGVGGRLTGVRLASGEPFAAGFEDVPDATTLGTVRDAAETTVVDVEDAHAVRVLDPETLEATSVPRPDYFDPKATTVPAFRSRAGLHILPEDAVAERAADADG